MRCEFVGLGDAFAGESWIRGNSRWGRDGGRVGSCLGIDDLVSIEKELVGSGVHEIGGAKGGDLG